MKYRKFGKMDWEISVLGLSIMKMQSNCESLAACNESDCIKFLHYAIDNGINYLDLGFPFHLKKNQRVSMYVAKALLGGYREKIKIAVNLPSHSINGHQDLDRYLGEQLECFNLESIDFCMIGGLDRKTWPKLQKLDFLGWADKTMKSGKISNLGFTFHDDVIFLRDIVEAYEKWSHCQFQFSFMDVSHHPGISGLAFAAEKGLPVIVTDPLKGRRLLYNIPNEILPVWGTALEARSLTEWGMRFVWNRPEVVSVIGDVLNLNQLRENLEMADSDSSEAGNLTVLEQLTLNRVKDTYRNLRPIACTACRVCMPCPIEIDVPRIFELYNDAIIYNDSKFSSLVYHIEEHNIAKCCKCGKCQQRCPKRLQLLNVLDSAKKLFECREDYRC